jgi:hypothetical protein
MFWNYFLYNYLVIYKMVTGLSGLRLPIILRVENKYFCVYSIDLIDLLFLSDSFVEQSDV